MTTYCLQYLNNGLHKTDFTLLFTPCICIKLLSESCSNNTNYTVIFKSSYKIKPYYVGRSSCKVSYFYSREWKQIET